MGRGRGEKGGGELGGAEGAGKADVAGGGTHVDVEGAIHHLPGASIHIPDGNVLLVNGEDDLLGDARRGVDFLEPAQQLGRFACGLGEP